MIRLATANDVPTIMDIYEKARAFMAANGNATQWQAGYPAEELVCGDVNAQRLYVIEDGGVVRAVFMFFIGEDSTYGQIDGPGWLSEAPYGTIHRVASDGTLNNVFGQVVTFCEGKISHLRIDTHADNAVMRHLILKHGFSERGIIQVARGGARIAYEKGY